MSLKIESSGNEYHMSGYESSVRGDSSVSAFLSIDPSVIQNVKVRGIEGSKCSVDFMTQW